jgi:hypothetical protein
MSIILMNQYLKLKSKRSRGFWKKEHYLPSWMWKQRVEV